MIMQSSFLNLTLPELCSFVTTFEQPPGDKANLLEIVTQVCDVLKKYDPTSLNTWLKGDQLEDRLVSIFLSHISLCQYCTILKILKCMRVLSHVVRVLVFSVV